MNIFGKRLGCEYFWEVSVANIFGTCRGVNFLRVLPIIVVLKYEVVNFLGSFNVVNFLGVSRL